MNALKFINVHRAQTGWWSFIIISVFVFRSNRFYVVASDLSKVLRSEDLVSSSILGFIGCSWRKVALLGIDNYGCGRFPSYFEPVVLFAITDSTSVSEIPPDFRVSFPTYSLWLSSVCFSNHFLLKVVDIVIKLAPIVVNSCQ